MKYNTNHICWVCWTSWNRIWAGWRLTGRKTWVVDLGGPNRALYVAMSNTLAGVLMLAAGALTGLVARFWGHHGALLLLTAMALAGAVSTLWLKDAE